MKLTESHIRSFVAEPYFSRGKAYCANGDIILVSITPQKVTAKVQGSRIYRVTLTLINNRFSGTCSCPAASDFGPCKHIAGTGFAVIKNQAGKYTPAGESYFSSEETIEFAQLLKNKTKAELIDIIVNWCDNDPELMNEL